MTSHVRAQDPHELFEVVTAAGIGTGQRKPRYAVHRDGDWHRAIHVWLVCHDGNGQPCLVFQRRGLEKDTWPGYLDATVGGHVRAGERLEDTLRETEEEIGLAVEPKRLRWLGVRIAVTEREPDVRDRELQDVFLVLDEPPLTELRPNPDELEALVSVPIDGVLALFAGECEAVEGIGLGSVRRVLHPVTVRLSDFIPSVDRYPYRMAIAARHVLRGERHVAI
ncbi:MAG: DNA mismatch repair protein MutT [Thermomicrobiales bacterium]|nr:MAG: DNA mismatch repair protein MutT [Thermomicrobiales bacterium]